MGVALQALVGAALGACTRQCDALTAVGVHTLMHVVPVDTALLLTHVFVLARFPGLVRLKLGGANPAALAIKATGTVCAALQALEKVCVCGSPGPFALGAGAEMGAVDPAATGAMLQALVGARRGAARKALDNDPGKGLTWEVANGAITESPLPSWKRIGATAHP
ncbi:hypothetical protein B0H14DRAFT_3470036 [Mycena olivaceomarginata]|nr:hypothetical protein B0H14DRAFT_3470036 [Mycena olivaceomarginata]